MTVVAFIMLIALIIISLVLKITIAYALCAGLVLFAILALLHGNSLKSVTSMILLGSVKIADVIVLLGCIGVLIATWMSSGTIPYLCMLGTNLIRPSIFVPTTFVLCCLLSFLIGTAYGTAGILGVVLMTIARGGGMNIDLIAGAILCGIYFGERCSPMSPSLLLLTKITDSNIYDNVKISLMASLPPAFICTVLYALFSITNKSENLNGNILSKLSEDFFISPLCIIPAALVIVLLIMKLNVKLVMCISIMAAGLMSFSLQGNDMRSIFHQMVYGFYLSDASPLYKIIRGGGVLSMVGVSVIILCASIIGEIVKDGKLIKLNEQGQKNYTSRAKLYLTTMVTSLVTAAIGCSQIIAIISTKDIMEGRYHKAGLSKNQLIKDITMTASLVPIVMPWNAAVVFPIAVLGIQGIGHEKYLFLVYVAQIYSYIKYKFEDIKNLRTR